MMAARQPVADRLPDFPWDTILDARNRAQNHVDGIVDLSIGTPIDPTPQVARDALAAATESPGYPLTSGTVEFRQAVVDYLHRRFRIKGLTIDHVLPLVGSKEFISGLPTQLGLGPGDVVAIPQLAYPTYEVGARVAGCDVMASRSTVSFGPIAPKLYFINSPANPHGKIYGADHMRKILSWARERGTIVASDECYLEFAWDAKPVSMLDEQVCEGNFEGIIAIHSLSKRSNLAGYRIGFAVGDPKLIAELLEARKHLGLMLPGPMQKAAIAVLNDDTHVDEQIARYRERRVILGAALQDAGFTIDDSEGSLYLWATRGENCRVTLDWLADRGILVAPGDFYGSAGANHVRFALTASDEHIDAAAARLTQ